MKQTTIFAYLNKIPPLLRIKYLLILNLFYFKLLKFVFDLISFSNLIAFVHQQVSFKFFGVITKQKNE
jgi:hypothetical protein